MANDLGFVPDNQTAAATAAPMPQNSLGFVPDAPTAASDASAPQGAPQGQPAASGGGNGNWLDSIKVPTISASPDDTMLSAGVKTGLNVIPSAINFGLGIAKLPIQGAENLAKIPGAFADAASNFGGGVGGVLKAAGTLAENIPGAAYKALVPQAVQQLISGDTQGARQTITEDPAGQVLPFLLLGREAAYKASPEAGAAFDSTVSKVASPVTAAGSVIGKAAGGASDLAGGMGRFAASQATGLFPQTIKAISENPSEFTKANITSMDRPTLAANIKTVLDARIEDLSDTGKGYSNIRASEKPITVNPYYLKNLIEETTKLRVDGEGNTQFPYTIKASGASSIRTPADVKALQTKILDVWQPEFAKGFLTPDEFLNFRKDLGDMAKYEGGIGKSGPLQNLSDVMRGKTNTALRDQIPGLANLDSNFASQAGELNQLKQGILDKGDNLTDASINRIANAANKGRTMFLGKLEEIMPGITKKIQILKAIEDIENAQGQKVGTYTRAAIGGGGLAAGLVSGNIPLVAGAISEMIAASPEVAVPLFRAYGNVKGLWNGVIGKLKSGASTNIPSLGSVVPQKITGSR